MKTPSRSRSLFLVALALTLAGAPDAYANASVIALSKLQRGFAGSVAHYKSRLKRRTTYGLGADVNLAFAGAGANGGVTVTTEKGVERYGMSISLRGRIGAAFGATLGAEKRSVWVGNEERVPTATVVTERENVVLGAGTQTDFSTEGPHVEGTRVAIGGDLTLMARRGDVTLHVPLPFIKVKSRALRKAERGVALTAKALDALHEGRQAAADRLFQEANTLYGTLRY